MLPTKPYFKDINKLKLKEWKNHAMLSKKSWSVTLTVDEFKNIISSKEGFAAVV